MKPLKLTMSAFGSYVKETAIDFERHFSDYRRYWSGKNHDF